MSAPVGTLAVKLAALTGDFNRDISAAAKEIDKISKAASDVAKECTAAFVGITAAIGFAVKAADEESIGLMRLTTALRGVGAEADADKFVRYAEGMQAAIGTSKEMTLQAVQTLAGFKLTGDEISALLPGLADYAVVMDTDVAGAAEKVGKAISSGSDNLAKMGLAMTESQKAAWETSDQYERVGLMAKILSESVGGAAEQMRGTATAAFGAMSGAAGDLAESFGAIFKDDVASLFNGVADAMRGLKERFDELNPETKKSIEHWGMAAVGLTAYATAVSTSVVALGKMVPLLKEVAVISGKALLPILAVTAGAGLAGILKNGSFLSGLDDLGEVIGALQARIMKSLSGAGREAPDLPLAPLVGEGSGTHASTGKIGKNPYDFGYKESAPDEYDIAPLTTAEQDLAELTADGHFYERAIPGGLTEEQKAINDSIAERAALGGKLGDMAFSNVLGAASEASSNAMQENAAKLQALSESFAAAAAVATDAALKEEYLSKAKEYAARAVEERNKPNAGAIMGAAAQGFAQGGIFGAIINVVGSLLGKLQSFGRLMGSLSDGLVPIMTLLEPIIEIVASLVSGVYKFTMKTTRLGEFIEAVAGVIAKISEGIDAVFGGLAKIYNWMIEKIADAASIIPKWGDELAAKIRRAKISWDDSLEEAPDLDEFDKPLAELPPALEGLVAAVKDFSSELQNIPEGFKVPYYRYNATFTPPTGGIPAGSMTGPANPPPINVEKIEIVANDPEQLATELRKIGEWKSFVISGSAVSSNPRTAR